MRSKISTLASTAMPIESTMPASPGSVSVASMHREPAEREEDVERERRDREDARSAGSRVSMIRTTNAVPDDARE